MILRDYQQRDVERIRDSLRRNRRVLYQAPTGSGKTVLFCYIAKHAASKGTRTCILVHRRELLKQASRKLTENGVHHGIVSPDHPTTQALVQVASKDTLARRMDRYEFDFIVCDEAHHATAPTFQSILDRHPVLGVTATPCRLSGTGLGTVFDELVTGPTVSELMAGGHLSTYKYLGPPCRVNLKGVKAHHGDWDRDALAKILDNPAVNGDVIEHYAKHLDGRPALAFCSTVAHAESIAEQFRAAGYRAESVDGKMHNDVRDDRIAAIGDGRLNVLTSCELIGEGLDVPCVYGALLIRPTKSLSVFLQQIGRVLRPAEGKQAVVLDHVGNYLRHGLPDTSREWTLDQGAGKDKPQERIRQCPNCWTVHDPAPTCPNCGYAYSVERKTVRQMKYNDAALEEIRISDAEAGDLFRKARTLQQFHDAAKLAGKKPGYAFMKWKVRMRG